MQNIELPNDVEPSHYRLENRLPSDIAAYQGSDDRGSGQNENDHTKDAAFQGLDAEQAEDTGQEHDQARGHRNEGAKGRKEERSRDSRLLMRVRGAPIPQIIYTMLMMMWMIFFMGDPPVSDCIFIIPNP